MTVCVKHIKLLLSVAFMAVVVSSCITDNPGGLPAGGEEFETVDFTITVPGDATRALGTDDEYRIEQLDVLQFIGGRFAHRAIPSYDNITHTGNTYTFAVRMMEGDNQDIVVIANAKNKLNTVAGSWNTATAIQTALNQLVLTVAPADKITANGVMPRLPMFGIKKAQSISDNSNFTGDEGSIKLVRMAAKIEVVLTEKAATGSDTGNNTDAYSGADNSNFKITDVFLYNQPLEGWVAPETAAWNDPGDTTPNAADLPWYGGKTAPAKAVYYGLPAGERNEPLHYTGAADNVTPNAVHNSIYTFEAPAGKLRDNREYYQNTCIVMGGYYNGATGANKSYYRIDFCDPHGDPMPLLRNHNYTIKVQSVTGSGYDNLADAFENNQVNITTVVQYWNDENINAEL